MMGSNATTSKGPKAAARRATGSAEEEWYVEWSEQGGVAMKVESGGLKEESSKMDADDDATEDMKRRGWLRRGAGGGRGGRGGGDPRIEERRRSLLDRWGRRSLRQGLAARGR